MLPKQDKLSLSQDIKKIIERSRRQSELQENLLSVGFSKKEIIGISNIDVLMSFTDNQLMMIAFQCDKLLGCSIFKKYDEMNRNWEESTNFETSYVSDNKYFSLYDCQRLRKNIYIGFANISWIISSLKRSDSIINPPVPFDYVGDINKYSLIQEDSVRPIIVYSDNIVFEFGDRTINIISGSISVDTLYSILLLGNSLTDTNISIPIYVFPQSQKNQSTHSYDEYMCSIEDNILNDIIKCSGDSDIINKLKCIRKSADQNVINCILRVSSLSYNEKITKVTKQIEYIINNGIEKGVNLNTLLNRSLNDVK